MEEGECPSWSRRARRDSGAQQNAVEQCAFEEAWSGGGGGVSELVPPGT